MLSYVFKSMSVVIARLLSAGNWSRSSAASVNFDMVYSCVKGLKNPANSAPVGRKQNSPGDGALVRE